LESLKDLPNLKEFTELSDDSRVRFQEELGEEAPGPVESTASIAEDGEAAAYEPTPEASVKHTTDDLDAEASASEVSASEVDAELAPSAAVLEPSEAGSFPAAAEPVEDLVEAPEDEGLASEISDETGEPVHAPNSEEEE
jgi:segregation and condensation protein B